MRQSSKPGSRTNRGFTLIEVLVVVVIIAIVGTTMVLSMGVLQEDTDLKKEAVRLTTLIELAGEEALLQGREFGLKVTLTGYEFLIYDQDNLVWAPMSGDRIFRARALPEDALFALVLEDREVVLDDEKIVEDPEPQIMILSSGEFSPFELILKRDFSDEEFTIAGTANGRAKLTEYDPDE